MLVEISLINSSLRRVIAFCPSKTSLVLAFSTAFLNCCAINAMLLLTCVRIAIWTFLLLFLINASCPMLSLYITLDFSRFAIVISKMSYPSFTIAYSCSYFCRPVSCAFFWISEISSLILFSAIFPAMIYFSNSIACSTSFLPEILISPIASTSISIQDSQDFFNSVSNW